MPDLSATCILYLYMDLLVDKDTELNNEVPAEPEIPANMPLLEEMMKAGLCMGKKSSKTHPRMKPLVFGKRNGIEIIDVEQTVPFLDGAMDFVKNKIAANGNLLLVGTTPMAKDLVLALSLNLKLPHVTERWLGGTLTNFKTLSKRIAYFKKLKSDKEAGRLGKYTKKERLDFDRKIAKMSIMFGGVEDMAAVPQLLFVVDVKANSTAVREARRLKIPVVGIVNTDTDPELVEYPIPANDRAKSSIEWILNRLEKAVVAGREMAVASQKPGVVNT